MENPSNPQSEHCHGDNAADATASAQAKPQPQPERRAFDSLRDAIRKGAEDARTAAEKTIPKVKSAAAGALYWRLMEPPSRLFSNGLSQRVWHPNP